MKFLSVFLLVLLLGVQPSLSKTLDKDEFGRPPSGIILCEGVIKRYGEVFRHSATFTFGPPENSDNLLQIDGLGSGNGYYLHNKTSVIIFSPAECLNIEPTLKHNGCKFIGEINREDGSFAFYKGDKMVKESGLFWSDDANKKACHPVQYYSKKQGVYGSLHQDTPEEMASTNLNLYKLGGKIQAMFPSPPQDVGEIKSEQFSFQAFRHVDNENSLVYVSGFQTNDVRYSQSNVQKAINNFIKGNAAALGGSVLKLDSNKPSNGLFGSDYTIAYELQKNRVLKHGRVLYRDGRLYFWSIQEFPGSSTVDVLDLFNRNVGQFHIIM